MKLKPPMSAAELAKRAKALAERAKECDAEARHMLAAARLRSSTLRPYYNRVLFRLEPFQKPGLGTLAVDQDWRLYYDPVALVDGFVKGDGSLRKWTVAELADILGHEVWHILFCHHRRCRAAIGLLDGDSAKLTKRQQVIRTLFLRAAAEAEVNDGLVAEGFGLPDCVLPSKLRTKEYPEGMPEDQTAEWYLAELLKNDGGGGGGEDEGEDEGDDCQDCGSAADGIPRDWEEPGEGAARREALQDVVRQQVAQDIADAVQRGIGRVPEDLRRWAHARLKGPEIHWDKQISAAIRAVVSWASGHEDWKRNPPSRRSWERGVLCPSLRAPRPNICVVRDTSGSMGGLDPGSPLAAVTAQVEVIIRRCGVDEITLIDCDSAAASARKVNSARQARRVDGGGGTDMGVGIFAAAELNPRPDVCIVLTDTATPWPDSPPEGMRVVVGAVAPRERLEELRAGLPAWCRSVGIPAEEI